jgi:hypothetical protein
VNAADLMYEIHKQRNQIYAKGMNPVQVILGTLAYLTLDHHLRAAMKAMDSEMSKALDLGVHAHIDRIYGLLISVSKRANVDSVEVLPSNIEAATKP